jgi:hypothetical protein
MKNAIPLILCSALLACTSPSEKIKEMPPKQQRSALAEVGRAALVEALREIEGRTPISFLSIKQANVRPIEETIQRETLFRSAVKRTVGFTFEGAIENSALVASFKDFKIIIYYDAENGSNISSEELTVFKTIRAGGSETFRAEINQPDQTRSYRYVITRAVQAN